MWSIPFFQIVCNTGGHLCLAKYSLQEDITMSSTSDTSESEFLTSLFPGEHQSTLSKERGRKVSSNFRPTSQTLHAGPHYSFSSTQSNTLTGVSRKSLKSGISKRRHSGDTGREGFIERRRTSSLSTDAADEKDAQRNHQERKETDFTDKNYPSIPTTPISFPEASTSGYLPPHFCKGSVVLLEDGNRKFVEELSASDFIHSAALSKRFRISPSKVTRIRKHCESMSLSFTVESDNLVVTVHATQEHPFFVFDRGWASCNPRATLARYGIHSETLMEGDICVTLTNKRTS